jgi:tRNA(Ile)-lysidine synthase
MTLLHGLLQLAPEQGWKIHVVHVDHQLRGHASEQDAQYVASYCEQKQVPYQVKRVNVTESKAITGGSIQTTARRLRYKAFREVAEEWKISKLVLAHHADDQVETILMRILRGTGPSGLVGIRTHREWGNLQIVRPLRNIFREELEGYLQKENIVPREDESNQSLTYTRNRLRLELMPTLLQYNPQVKQSILQLGNLMEDEEQVWAQKTIESVKLVANKVGNQEYQIDIKQFLTLPVALQRRTVKLILSCLTSRSEKLEIELDAAQEFPYRSIDQVLYLASHSTPSVWISLPGGIKGVRSYDILRLTKDYINVVEQEWSCPLQVPGITYLSNGFMKASLSTTLPTKTFTNKSEAVFDAGELALDNLTVRNRRAGDRIRPYGFQGHKQVKSLLMEEKIPLAERGKQPFVVSGNEIIWIAGVRHTAIAPVTDHTTHFLMLVWSVDTESF